jgi:hypothetical protein
MVGAGSPVAGEFALREMAQPVAAPALTGHFNACPAPRALPSVPRSL